MNRKNRIFSKATTLLSILLLSCLVIGQMAFAEGDGTGGGSSEPLSLVSSSISNGATGVSLKPSITLTFSKNIVNMSVSDNNKSCFSLINANGANVPIDIIFADDQIDREKRNDALIIPKANLAPGTNYTLVVSSALRSKSGVTMGKDVRISFTTEGSQPAPNQNSSVTAPKPETSAPPTTAQPSTSKPETSSANATSTKSTTTNNGENALAQDSQTAANSPTDEKSSDVSAANENKANQENIKKPKPYQAVDSINTETESDKQENNSSSTWVVATIIIILGATAALVYFYKRKKRTAK